MQTIGIIGAMEEELEFIRSKMEVLTVEQQAGLDYAVGLLQNKKIVLVKSGIGKVNAAVCTQILIDRFAVDKVINIGVAGAIYHDLKIGDIVISSDAVQHDMDTSEFGDPIGVIPRMKESYFKADPFLISTAKKAAQKITGISVIEGRVASGDQFIASTEGKERIWSNVGGYCAEMEGAAIAQVCYLNQVGFVLIRSISDNAGDGSTMDYQQFVTIAANNAGTLLYEMIGQWESR